MSFVHLREFMSSGDIAIVDCAPECHIMLMNDANFSRYQRGKKFFCREEAKRLLPASLMAPVAGYWNIVLEFASDSSGSRHSIQIVRNGP